MTVRPVGAVFRGAAAAPFSVGFAVMLWAIGWATGSINSGPGPALMGRAGVGVAAFRQLHWWSPVTAALWGANWGSYLAATALLLGICLPMERRIGTRRAVELFLTSQIAGAAIGVAAITVGSAVGEKWSIELAQHLMVGPTAGLAGVALGAGFALSARRRRRIQLLFLIALTMLALYSGQLSDVVRLCGGLVGLVVGRVTLGGRRITSTPATPREQRTLVALLVAASAVGPLLAVIGESTTGPFSVLQSLLLSAPPEPAQVQAACLDLTDPTYCRLLQAQTRLIGLGPAVMSILPVLLVLALAEGLRRGRRFAGHATITVNLVLAALGGLLSYLNARELAEGRIAAAPVSAQVWVERAVPIVLPLLIALLVFRTRDRFRVTAPAGTYHRMFRRAARTGGAVCAVFVLAGWIVRGQFDHRATITQLVADLPSRFIPPGYLGVAQPSILPVGGVAVALYGWIGVIFWAVVLGTMVSSFWRSRIETDSVAASEARALVVAHGTNSLSYMATWLGNHYWFTPDQRSLVAYRVVATVALTVGDPIGPVDQRQAAVHGFADYCQANGWTPCLYSVTEPTAGLAREFGWKSLHIAEDAVLPLGDLRFTGRKWQDIRTALNRAAKSGMTASWITYPTAGRGITSQIDAISAQWIADKQMPEMGFTLGGVRELDDPQVRCLLAVDSHDRVVAVTSWLPIHDDGRITGWTMDFMRRTPDASPGVMEFLIATATQEFQAQGAALLSLSGAPLARMTPDGRSPALHKVLDILAASLEPAYGFRSLLAFKAKFQPTYNPLYLTYPGAADLPTIANAIGRAYLPHITPHEGFKLARRLITRLRRQKPPTINIPPRSVEGHLRSARL